MWALRGRAIYVMACIVARFGVDNGHQNDTCHDEVGLMGGHFIVKLNNHVW